MTRQFDPAEIPAFPDLHFESELWEKGYIHVAGLDEAGRGSWAGPVTAGAVIFPIRLDLPDLLPRVRDSKKMSPREREFWAYEIQQQVEAWGIGFASNQEIDCLGIVPATRLAMTRAISELRRPVEHLLIDALRLPEQTIPQTSLIKGDARALSIAAASVLAKTARDAFLRKMESEYPGYGFAQNKGYGTAQHWKALKLLGPCAIHRKSYIPVQRAGTLTEFPVDL